MMHMYQVLMVLYTIFIGIGRSYDLKNGDLVFVNPPLDRESAFGRAIIETGEATIGWWQEHGVKPSSNSTAVHVAVYLGNGSIIEAVPKFGVRRTTETRFFEEYPTDTKYYFGRVKNVNISSILDSILLAQLGKPYADDFQAPPHRFYCSSLVTYAFMTALNVSFSPPFELIFEPLGFWRQYYASMNLTLPPKGTLGSNPTLLLHSPHVDIVHSI